MRIALLALLAVSTSFCQRQEPTKSAPTPIETKTPEVRTAQEEAADDPFVKLLQRVQPKMKPEFLDELIERANTPDSLAINVNKIKANPGMYHGHPWWFTGKLIHIKQSKDGCNLTIEPVGADNFSRFVVFGDFNIDFVRFEEVDVIGYIATDEKSHALTMLAHSVLKKGAIKERLEAIRRN